MYFWTCLKIKKMEKTYKRRIATNQKFKTRPPRPAGNPPQTPHKTCKTKQFTQWILEHRQRKKQTTNPREFRLGTVCRPAAGGLNPDFVTSKPPASLLVQIWQGDSLGLPWLDDHILTGQSSRGEPSNPDRCRDRRRSSNYFLVNGFQQKLSLGLSLHLPSCYSKRWVQLKQVWKFVYCNWM